MVTVTSAEVGFLAWSTSEGLFVTFSSSANNLGFPLAQKPKDLSPDLPSPCTLGAIRVGAEGNALAPVQTSF